MMQNIPKEKVLEIVKQGPTIPNKIAKTLGADTIIIGAVLSTLASSGEIKVSKIKIGGTPLYYVPDQEVRLEEFIDHLGEKDRKTFQLLKEKKILQDSLQDPLIRVSLKSIPDFAKPFEAVINGKKELFYRFFLIAKDEAGSYVKTEKPVDIKDIIAEHLEKSADNLSEKHEVVHIEKHADKISDVKSKEIIKETEDEKLRLEEPVQEEKKEESEKTEEKTSKSKIIREDFFEMIKTFIHNKNLDIINKEKIKKSEYSLVLKNHDENEYIFCKAKDKKTISDGDLATAFVFAQNKKMPCLFITTGKLTKKADSMMHKEFSGMRFEQITI